MRQIKKHFIITVIISIILFTINNVFALNNEEEESKRQYQRYDEIRREHNKDYQKGVYKDEKKDYVKKWIDDDINYQKRVIKLKSDYRAWAAEKRSAGREVIFKEYEPLENLTAAEKEILLEYHNNLFKSKDKENANKSAESKKGKKIKPKKVQDQKIIVSKKNEVGEKKQNDDLREEKIPAESAANRGSADEMEIGTNIYIYMILGFALLLIITECIYLIVKRIK
jgi:hypothetical protein